MAILELVDGLENLVQVVGLVLVVFPVYQAILVLVDIQAILEYQVFLATLV